MNIIKWLISLFARTETFHPVLGALESPADDRNIPLSSFQAPVALPDAYVTPMPPVEDQGQFPICVGEAITKVGDLYFAKKGINVSLSPSDLYGQCKQADGQPGVPGTIPAVGAKVACDSGVISSDDQNRADHRLGGYAFVSGDFHSICQAIFQNGAITARLLVDAAFEQGIMQKPVNPLGGHYVVLHGYDLTRGVLIGQNSWGNWTGYVHGIKNPALPAGHFEVLYSDIASTVSDIIAFADVPADLIAKAKGTPKAMPQACTIVRTYGDKETKGILTGTNDKGETLSLVTLELPWLNNQHNISCIPEGTYVCKYNSNPANGMLHYLITNVPNRSAVYLHPMNFATYHTVLGVTKPPEILGCIGVGSQFADINGDGIMDISGSGIAVSRLESFYGKKDFTLTITHA
jgi:hypothetical protein